MDISGLKTIPIADFLRRLGHAPVAQKGRELTYFAPYREEHKPSFCVNAEKNVFYDFGTGCGGDIFKLAGEFIHSSDFKAQAKYIADSMNVQLPMKEHPSFVSQPTEPVFQNVEISRLESPTLLRYLAQRGIPKEIAQKYCVKVDYQLRGKDYYAIGFENNAHGYELRSAFFKGSFPPKHITHIANGNGRCNIFEGFIYFLSAEKLGYNDGNDSLILNSVSNLHKALPFLSDYPLILCYLDNDAAGREALAKLQKEFGDRVADKSSLYPDHKDLNEYLVSISPKHTNKLKF
jgi:DNA primase